MNLIVLVILVSITCSVCGQLSLKAGMNRVGRLQRGASIHWRRGLPLVLVGLGIYGLSVLLWLYVLSRVELSFAFPFLSLSFVAILLGARHGLGEPLGRSRVVGASCIVLGVLVVSLSHDPEADSTLGAARSEWRDEGRPVLLLLADSWGESRARRGEEPDPSAEWSNLLVQLFGNCDIQPSSRLVEDPDSLLSGRELVVLPRRTLEGLDPEIRGMIDDRISGGRPLILTEGPNEAWAHRLGLRTAAVEGRTWLPWPYDGRAGFLQGSGLLPLVDRIRAPWTLWRYAPSPDAHPRTRPTASLGGRPTLWTRPVGRGYWMILDLDLGGLAARMRRGEVGPSAARTEPWLDAWVFTALRAEGMPMPWPHLDCGPFDTRWVVADSSGGAEAPRNLQPRFRETEISGATIASHLGPRASGRGFVLGSALPYRPLDRRGRLFSFWELPRLRTQDPPPPREVDLWLGWRDRGSRSPLLLPATPGQDTVDPTEFVDWWQSRTELRWRWSWKDPWLEVDFAEQETAHPFALVVPFRWRRRALRGWESSDPATRSERGWRFDEEVLRLEVPSRGGRLRLRYGAPTP